jgi:uncharacterized iron-regulated membrane protein
MIRWSLLLVHRWCGLVIAAFLIMAGLTGAVISWDHELDDLLNSHLTKSPSQGTPTSVLDLAARVEAQDRRARVTYVPLIREPGDSVAISVEPTVDPRTGELYELGYNELFFDPVSGRELGRREWGKPALTRENLVPFLYVLHYSLHIPAFWGSDRWGVWLMGVIALVWTLDCFVGFYLTLPRQTRAQKAATAQPLAIGVLEVADAGEQATSWWRRWKPAWQVKWSATGRRINFDLHRATGLWLWAFLFVLAVSAMSLNLYTEVAQPLVSAVSDFTPSPYDLRSPKPLNQPIDPQVPFADVIERGRAEGVRRGWTEPVGAVSYAPLYGIHAVLFFHAGGDHGVGGVGARALYFDSADGRYLGEFLPWTGTAGDLFLQLQFPVHSGRVAGVPGRIFISFMGLAVALLSATGVVIWWQKRSASMLALSRLRKSTNASQGTPLLASD